MCVLNYFLVHLKSELIDQFELVCKHWTNKSFVECYRLEIVAIVWEEKKPPNQNKRKRRATNSFSFSLVKPLLRLNLTHKHPVTSGRDTLTHCFTLSLLGGILSQLLLNKQLHFLQTVAGQRNHSNTKLTVSSWMLLWGSGVISLSPIT